MKTYTLHVRPDALPGQAEALDRAVLVKDGFAWGAFFFSFLWFFVHRLWLAGLIVLAAVVALGGVMQFVRAGPVATFWAKVLLALLVGFEANSLRRWTLARRGRPPVDVVSAHDVDEAETKAFGRWLNAAPPSAAAPVSRPPAPLAVRRNEPVIGLFPEAERAR